MIAKTPPTANVKTQLPGNEMKIATVKRMSETILFLASIL